MRDQGRGIHLVGTLRRPDDGGVIGPAALGVPAAVACFPFLREGRVIDVMRDTGEWYGSYAERVGRIAAALNEGLDRGDGRGHGAADDRALHGRRREGRRLRA